MLSCPNRKSLQCYNPKLGLDYNLDKDLSKEGKNDQIIKYKDIDFYLQLFISNDYEKRESCP